MKQIIRFSFLLLTFVITSSVIAQEKPQPLGVDILATNTQTNETQISHGILLGDKNLILTNWEAVAGADEIKIQSWQGNTYTLKEFVTYDISRNLVLLSVKFFEKNQVQLPMLPVLPYLDEELMAICQPVYEKIEGASLVHFPLKVKELREVEEIGTLIVTDSKEKFDENGCAVVDHENELVGITSIRASQTNTHEVYVIPWNMIEPLWKDYEAMGSLELKQIGFDDSEEDFNLAVDLLWEKKFKPAEKALKEIIENDPEYIPALFHLGSLYYQQNQYRQSNSIYQKVLDLDPEYSDVYHNMGLNYDALGQTKKSIEILERGIEQAPHFSHTYQTLIVILTQQKQYEKAWDLAKQGIEKDPKYEGFYENLSYIATARKQPQKALEVINELIFLNPLNCYAYNAMGYVQGYFYKQHKKELEYLDMALLCDPTMDAAYYNKGYVLHEFYKKPLQAIENYLKALEFKPEDGSVLIAVDVSRIENINVKDVLKNETDVKQVA